MRRWTLLIGLLVAAPFGLTAPDKPRAKTSATKLNGHNFTVPEGFEVVQAAGPPLVDRPIVADFDEQGRLYVADSSGLSERAEEQLKKTPHRIVRLEDTDGDGVFDKSIVFADKMMFPEGAMWHAGSLYVAAPPSIWRLTDTDGDGVADHRSEWFQGKTLTGCANDLHGPYLGPDGWVYWCKGAFAKQSHERPGKKPFVTRAAHIFRCKPDGSGIEPVMTGGMDNPVDVAFTSGGERLFTTTFLQRPGGGNRDGLIHAVYGGVYGKDHDPIYEHPWTAPTLMPVLTHMGAAAPAGLTRYESAVFGEEYRDNLFAAQFNLRKVSRHSLEPDGATFKSHDSDFLVSDSHDFHPTDVLEDADGSLLAIDTGGWYKMCCPTSQLVKPDVLGAIYRVRKKGAAKIGDPRGLKLEWTKATPADLAKRLDDARPVVRKRAVEALAAKGADALKAIADSATNGPSAEARRNAVWTATRIEDAAARGIARAALADRDETVRQVAIHSISVRKDGEAIKGLVKLLDGPAIHNRRAAAEALGRLGDKAAVAPLLEAVGQPAGRVLEHSLTYALIEIADREGTAAGLKNTNPLVRRAALVALDQMEDGNLDVRTVAAELTSEQPVLKETAAWIASRHPDWGDHLAGYFRDRLAAKDLNDASRDELATELSRFAKAPAIQTMLADRAADARAAGAERRAALRAMSRSRLPAAPDAWFATLAGLMTDPDAEIVHEAVQTTRSLPAPKKVPAELTTSLLHIGSDGKRPEVVRLTALASIPSGLPTVEGELFAFLRDQLDGERPVATRFLAADVLSRAGLTTAQLVELASALKSSGPMEVTKLLDAFGKSTDEKVGLALVKALNTKALRPALRSDSIKPKLAKFGPAVQKEADSLFAALDLEFAKQKERLAELLAGLKPGDVRKGQGVFNNQKAACVTCHAIGYQGGKVGPDLTRIGKVRTERDLLEAIVYPSASFVRSYESVTLTTKKGKVVNGVLKRDAADEVVLALSATEEFRVARDEIEDMRPGTVSIMPSGLDQQLSPQELADLIAFLKACQ